MRNKETRKQGNSFFLSLLLAFSIVFVGCQDFESDSVLSHDLVAKERAISIAEGALSGMSGIVDNWDSSSYVKEAFPVYLAGVEQPSYYECKVVTGDVDAGYILVNINETDLPVVEASNEGFTVSELIQDETGRDDLYLYRYGFFSTIAYDKPLTDNSRSSNNVLYSFGNAISNSQSIEFENQVKSRGCVPYYSKEILATQNSDNIVNSRSVDEITELVELKNYYYNEGYYYENEYVPFPHSAGRGYHHTASFIQYYDNFTNSFFNTYPVGCGPTAWAIVYAYWYSFHGKSDLFRIPNGYTITGRSNIRLNGMGEEPGSEERIVSGIINQCMARVASLTNTFWGDWGGATTMTMMNRGIRYAKERGYSNSSSTRRGGGTYTPKFNIVRDSLSEDRPVILGVNSSGTGLNDHYVVAEKAMRGSSWIAYFCNFGWGQGIEDKTGKNRYNDRWIFALGETGDPSTDEQIDRHSTYCVWDIKID
ncbi:MAG: C10 family peptidase [Spirochaetales bacterium]|nr:C10 family peptidase [Spirochaetales bacterium]